MIEEEIINKYDHNDLFIIVNNYKRINKKVFYKARRRINYKIYKENRYILAVVIGLIATLTPLSFIIIILNRINNPFVAIGIITGMILFRNILFRLVEHYFNIIDTFINKKCGYIKIDKYKIFINVFIKNGKSFIDKKELLSDYFIIKELDNNKNKTIEFIKNAIITIGTALIEFEFSPIFDIVRQTKNTIIIGVCISIYCILIICCLRFVDKFLDLFSDSNNTINNMYEVLLFYQNDINSFIDYYAK